MDRKKIFTAFFVVLCLGFFGCENSYEDELLERMDALEQQLNGNGNNVVGGTSQEGLNQGTSAQKGTGSENGFAYVDLGLPSGLKWAICNVGATSPEEYGDYYAWGETTTKVSYTQSNYSYTSDPAILPLSDDAAAVNMGGSWRMPTKEEWGELMDECSWFWKYGYNGKVSGYLVKSKHNDNSIFFPAAGYRYSSDLSRAGSYGNYWSSSLDADSSDYAYNLYFSSDYVYWNNDYRYFALSVRGVFSH